MGWSTVAGPTLLAPARRVVLISHVECIIARMHCQTKQGPCCQHHSVLRPLVLTVLRAVLLQRPACVVQGDDGVSARDQWVLCCDPMPEAPEGAKLMASEHLPISV